MDKAPRQRGIKQKVVEFLMEHPGKDFTPESIALSANLPLMSVKNTMSKLVQEGLVAYMEAPQGGIVRGFYHYNGKDHAQVGRGTMMEVLKVRPNGEVIMIDEFGDFWVSRKVEM